MFVSVFIRWFIGSGGYEWEFRFQSAKQARSLLPGHLLGVIKGIKAQRLRSYPLDSSSIISCLLGSTTSSIKHIYVELLAHRSGLSDYVKCIRVELLVRELNLLLFLVTSFWQVTKYAGVSGTVFVFAVWGLFWKIEWIVIILVINIRSLVEVKGVAL